MAEVNEAEDAAAVEQTDVSMNSEPDLQNDETEHVVQTTKKKRKVADSLSEETEQSLADWFAANPLFWDQSLRDFKRKDKKERLLVEKAREFNLTG